MQQEQFFSTLKQSRRCWHAGCLPPASYVGRVYSPTPPYLLTHRSFPFLLPFFLAPNRAESVPSSIPASSGRHSPISAMSFPTTASSTPAAHHQDGPGSPPVGIDQFPAAQSSPLPEVRPLVELLPLVASSRPRLALASPSLPPSRRHPCTMAHLE